MHGIFKQVGKSITTLGSGPAADQSYLDQMMKVLGNKDQKDFFVAVTGTTLLSFLIKGAAKAASNAARKASATIKIDK